MRQWINNCTVVMEIFSCLREREESTMTATVKKILQSMQRVAKACCSMNQCQRSTYSIIQLGSNRIQCGNHSSSFVVGPKKPGPVDHRSFFMAGSCHVLFFLVSNNMRNKCLLEYSQSPTLNWVLSSTSNGISMDWKLKSEFQTFQNLKKKAANRHCKSPNSNQII